MQKIVSVQCPKCNNSHPFYVTSKLKMDFKNINAVNANQLVPNKPKTDTVPKYPFCHVCGKAAFLYCVFGNVPKYF